MTPINSYRLGNFLSMGIETRMVIIGIKHTTMLIKPLSYLVIRKGWIMKGMT
jgi:hypothetical protein